MRLNLDYSEAVELVRRHLSLPDDVHIVIGRKDVEDRKTPKSESPKSN